MKKTVSECVGCEGCPMRRLFPDNTFVAPTFGASTRLRIGEAPGEEEALAGAPFVGGAGRWLDSFYRQAGTDPKTLTTLNVIQCRPPKNVFPTAPEARGYISPSEANDAVEHCLKNHVRPLLRGRPWSRIDLLGDTALEYIGGRSEGITKWRGSPIPVPDLGGDKRIAMPTLHPAYIARNQEMIPVVINDLRKGLVVPPEHYNLYPSVEDVKNFRSRRFTFDIETMGWSKEISMVGISDEIYKVLVVPFRGPYIEEIKRIFREATDVVGHNSIQFDHPVLEHNGVTVSKECQLWDTMVMQHLLFPSLPHDLEFVGSQFSSKPAWKHDKGVFELYCARDVDVTGQAFKHLRPMLEMQGMLDLYKLVQVPLGKICKLMQTTGFKVDVSNIDRARERVLGEMSEAESKLPEKLRTHDVDIQKRELAPAGTLSAKTGKPIKYVLVPAKKRVSPWRSPQVKQKWLYDELAFPVQYDHKSKAITTGKEALMKLAKLASRAKEDHPWFGLAPTLMALREINKLDELVTTFCKEGMTQIERMYPHFNVHGTKSGRLSSSDPNLQNIPESTRFIYVPGHPGWRILECDYSQIENRLTAYFANDTKRLARFVADPSFSEHRYAASLFLGVPYSEVEKSSDPESEYLKAKKIVHGTNYGEGSQRIANSNDLDLRSVKILHDRWKQEIAATIEWQKTTADQAKKAGYLVNPFRRRRPFYTTSYYTESLSFLPQGTAADIIFRAMIALMYERIGWPVGLAEKVVGIVRPLPQPANLLIQVHDSLIFEYPPEIEEPLILTVKQVMEQPWPELGGFSCPIGIKTGPSWGEVKEYK